MADPIIRVSKPFYLSRRRFLQTGLAAASAGVAGSSMAAITGAGSTQAVQDASPVAEEIRSSQSTVLEASGGKIAKVRIGAKAFLDSPETLTYLPEEFLARSFVRSNKNDVKAVCMTAGYVYAVTVAGSVQEQELLSRGFKLLDFPTFQAFGETGSKDRAFQKNMAKGERLELKGWVVVIFGPEERGGVPYAKMRSLDPPAFLPDGSEFKTWEPSSLHFSRTYYVDQAHPEASDSNPGTEDQPFKTINRAAQALEPDERVIVKAGVYREWVRPARGGTDPEHLVSYEAAPGEKVVIKGSEILRVRWVKSSLWIEDPRFVQAKATVKQIWMTRLPEGIFSDYNPFGTANYRQVTQVPYWNLPEVFSDARSQLYLQICGLLFQNGRRLQQVNRYTDLYTTEGAFWVETNGLVIHVSPYDSIDPNHVEWEATAREQIFAPEAHHLGYIRVKGFTMEHAGNSFPFPQRGAISTVQGHHWIIEDNTVNWVNSVGIDIGDGGIVYVGPNQLDAIELPATFKPSSTLQSADQLEPPPGWGIFGYHILRRNKLNDIGISGIAGPGPYASLIEENVFHRNCWHDAECLAECSAIKIHRSKNILMRRNIISDTLYGTGVWIDTGNRNTRICQNVVVGTGSNYNGKPFPGAGGIYVEAAPKPNMIDHNFIWGSKYSNGFFAYTSSKLVVAHNLIGNCAAAGVAIRDEGGRTYDNRHIIPPGSNHVFANLFVRNGCDIEFYSAENRSDYNLFGATRETKPFQLLSKNVHLDLLRWRKAFGYDLHSSEVLITAKFNPDTLEFRWSVRGKFKEGPVREGMEDDFWGRPLGDQQAVPGPFGQLPKEATRIILDPRRRTAT